MSWLGSNISNGVINRGTLYWLLLFINTTQKNDKVPRFITPFPILEPNKKKVASQHFPGNDHRGLHTGQWRNFPPNTHAHIVTTTKKNFTVFTLVISLPPMHVELAPRRRETVPVSGRWRGAGRGGGEVRPGSCDGFVDVQVVEEIFCKRRRKRCCLGWTSIKSIKTRSVKKDKMYSVESFLSIPDSD